MSESQDLYADSDLAPLSELFGEMGDDRSFWRKYVGDVYNAVSDFSKARVTFRNKSFLGIWKRWLFTGEKRGR